MVIDSGAYNRDFSVNFFEFLTRNDPVDRIFRKKRKKAAPPIRSAAFFEAAGFVGVTQQLRS